MKNEQIRTAFVLPADLKLEFDLIVEKEFYNKIGPFLRELIRAEINRRKQQ